MTTQHNPTHPEHPPTLTYPNSPPKLYSLNPQVVMCTMPDVGSSWALAWWKAKMGVPRSTVTVFVCVCVCLSVFECVCVSVSV